MKQLLLVHSHTFRFGQIGRNFVDCEFTYLQQWGASLKGKKLFVVYVLDKYYYPKHMV